MFPRLAIAKTLNPQNFNLNFSLTFKVLDIILEKSKRKEKKRKEKKRKEKKRKESNCSGNLSPKKKKPYYFGGLKVIKINISKNNTIDPHIKAKQENIKDSNSMELSNKSIKVFAGYDSTGIDAIYQISGYHSGDLPYSGGDQAIQAPHSSD